MATKSSVEQLNSFLRGEISAVETYQMALDKIEKNSAARQQLMENLSSHQNRVTMLREAIIAAGGDPATGSGPWGVFAKVVEGGAKVLGEKATIAALEEGEDHGLADYKRDIDEVDAEMRGLVSRLLPEQQQTHDRLSALKRRM